MPDAQGVAPLTRLTRALLLAVVEGASLGFAGWSLVAPASLTEEARSNGLAPLERRDILLNIGAGIGIALLVLVALFVWKRKHALPLVERLVHRAAPLALAGAVPLLLDWRIWRDREAVFFFLVLGTSFALRAALTTRWNAEPLLPRTLLARLRPRAVAFSSRVSERFDVGLVLVCLSAAAYAAYFSVITILDHRNLHTRSFDLALEDNLMWNLVHGGPLFKSTPFSGPTGTHFGHHATFFAFVMAPIYALFPGAETLLVLQATLIGAAAVPLFLYARRRLPEWVAAQVASMYLLYPPLHGANLYDFHYLPLGVFFLWLTLFAIDSKRWVLAVVAALLAISVREDVAFSLAVMGAFLLLAGEAALAGSILAAVGGLYFLVMKLGVMPRFKGGAESFVNQYAGLLPPGGKGFGAILGTMVENPGFTANVVLEKEKYPYVLQIFTPLLFLPLRYPIAVLLVAPGLIFTLLSTGYSPLLQISFQYTTYWTAFVFIGLVVTLARLSRRTDIDAPLRLRATMTSLFVATLFCTCFNGAFLRHDTVRGGFDPFHFGTTTDDLRRRGELARLVSEIPPSASVAATEFLVPHVSTRKDAYTIRFGTYDADYLLFELPLNGDERAHVYPLLQSREYGVIEDLGDMALAGRGHSSEGNAAVMRR